MQKMERDSPFMCSVCANNGYCGYIIVQFPKGAVYFVFVVMF